MDKRERNVAFLWADKRIFRFFREHFDKRSYRKLRDVYSALCEIDSDFTETRSRQTQLRNLTKTCATYAGMDQNIISGIMQVLRDCFGLIDYGKRKNTQGQIIGSFLTLYVFENNEIYLSAYKTQSTKWDSIVSLKKDSKTLSRINPIKGEPYHNKNNISKDILNKPYKKRFSKENTSCESRIRNEQTFLGKSDETYDKLVYELMDYWNTLQIVKHKEGLKTYGEGLRHLNIAIHHYSENEIKISMDKYKQLLSDPYNKIINKTRSPYKVTLPEFFGFSEYTRKQMNPIDKKLLHGVVSWFSECLNDKVYLQEKYNKLPVNKQPELTEQFKNYWLYYLNQQGLDTEITHDNERLLILLTNRLYDYWKKNKKKFTDYQLSHEAGELINLYFLFIEHEKNLKLHYLYTDTKFADFEKWLEKSNH